VVSLLVAGLCAMVPAVTHAQKAASVDAAGIYKQRCAMCHGAAGDALVPSQNFTDGDWKRGSSINQLMDVIRNGVPGTVMTAFKGVLTDAELQALARYVRHFDPKLRARSKE
jgi:cytochrome c oxidase cbb3-type subunit III